MSEEDYCQICADKAAREYRKPSGDGLPGHSLRGSDMDYDKSLSGDGKGGDDQATNRVGAEQPAPHSPETPEGCICLKCDEYELCGHSPLGPQKPPAAASGSGEAPGRTAGSGSSPDVAPADTAGDSIRRTRCEKCDSDLFMVLEDGGTYCAHCYATLLNKGHDGGEQPTPDREAPTVAQAVRDGPPLSPGGVYLVTLGEGFDYTEIAVFSTQERAEKYIAKQKYGYEWQVKEMLLDEEVNYP